MPRETTTVSDSVPSPAANPGNGADSTHHVPPSASLPDAPFLHLFDHRRLPERTDFTEAHSGVLGVPHKVHARDGAREDVEDGERDQLPVEAVQRVVRAVLVLGRATRFEVERRIDEEALEALGGDGVLCLVVDLGLVLFEEVELFFRVARRLEDVLRARARGRWSRPSLRPAPHAAPG